MDDEERAPRSLATAIKEFSSVIGGILVFVSACVVVYGWGVSSAKTEGLIDASRAEIARVAAEQDKAWDVHLKYHSERLAESKEREGAWSARIGALETNGNQAARLLDQLTSRVAVLEESQRSAASAQRETQKTVNEIAADLRVICAILQGSRDNQGAQRCR